MAAFGEVTRLMAKVENEPIKKIVVKKPVTKKKVFASVKEKETTASKNWQRDRHTDEKIAHHVAKLETEFHQKLRLLEEKRKENRVAKVGIFSTTLVVDFSCKEYCSWR